jgi:hypothetical protein
LYGRRPWGTGAITSVTTGTETVQSGSALYYLNRVFSSKILGRGAQNRDTSAWTVIN